MADPHQKQNLLWKRALDLTCLALAAPLVLLIGACLALLIKLVSPGPVLFRQSRVGFNGKCFQCFKFRTMKTGADTSVHTEHLTRLMASNGTLKKLDLEGDARLIPGGVWLRATGLDELPQLINVLRGEMSLVGPRPCLPYESERFPREYLRRFETLPGLTGLWQVGGKNRTTFEEMMALDLAYLDRKSLFLDVKILLLTLPALVLQVSDMRRARRKTGGSKGHPRVEVSRFFDRRVPSGPKKIS